MPSAYLLVFHGSRDPRPQAAVEKLAELVAQSKEQATQNTSFSHRLPWYGKGGRPRDCSLTPDPVYELAAPPVAVDSRLKPMVGTASLELSPVPLHQQIQEFGDLALTSGYNSIQVVPLFLLPGVHVMEDIPAAVAIAQQARGQELKIELRPYLGTHAGLEDLLATQLAARKAQAWILLAHGSRRAGSKEPVEAMARHLGIQAAYWAVPPRLESRVKELVSAGSREIGILPYFLFAGGITDAIAQSVEQLKVQFPGVWLQLADPLGASAELADLIVDLVRFSPSNPKAHG